MIWSLPTFIKINDKKIKIRNNCDYRVVLDVICALTDEELNMPYRIYCALRIFYDDFNNITDYNIATAEMIKIINCGDAEIRPSDYHIMDWQHDFKNIAPPISRVLGYSVRDEENYTHWYDFIGAYMEIGECPWSTFINIREKKLRGERMEKWEEKVYMKHKNEIDLPQKLTKDEQEWLDAEW